MSESEYLIMPKGMKFEGTSKLGISWKSCPKKHKCGQFAGLLLPALICQESDHQEFTQQDLFFEFNPHHLDQIIKNFPSKICSLDSIPTWLTYVHSRTITGRPLFSPFTITQ